MMAALTDKQQAWLERYNSGIATLNHFSTGSYLSECGDCPTWPHYEDGVSYECEPFFSWSACELCGSELGGNREVGHGFSSREGERDRLVHLYVCTDCVVMSANGEVPSEENL